jgi:predicted permease
METLFQDIRYALRSLRKSPGFALVAILTIGLAIGLNTMVFTWVERLVLRPLPGVPQSEELVSLQPQYQGGGGGLGYLDYRDWRDGARAFEGVATYAQLELSARASGPAQQAWGEVVSWNLFNVLRVRPILGRTFRPDEEAQAVPVAVISHALWQRAFGGDSGVVGRHLALNGRDFTVIGVTPPEFAGSVVALRSDVWIPVTLVELVTGWNGALSVRGWRFLEAAIARRRPGVSLEQARQDINGVNRRMAEANPLLRNSTVLARRYTDTGASSYLRPVMGALLGVTVLVLLTACANLANLLLARASARQREMGVRLAVGAGRARLIRQLLTESLVLTLCGGVVGVLIALWGKDVALALIPTTGFPIAIDLSVDARVLGVAAGVTVATGIAFGLVPALQASKVELVPALRDGAASGSARRSRLQSGLVTAQVALSLVSLVCAGLFVRGLQRARTVDTGIRQPEHVLLADVNTFAAGYSDSAGAVLVDRMLERVRAVPGVRSASVATQLPLGFGGFADISLEIDGYAFRPDEGRSALINWVSAQYFETAGVPIVRGRSISEQDRPGAPPVVVVNEAFARRFWPGQDPIGKRLRSGGSTGLWRMVVGVSRDVKGRSLAAAAPPIFYRPIQQAYNSRFTLHVRADGDPRALQQVLRRTFEELDPNLAFNNVRTMAEHMGAATFVQRIGAWLLSLFGALALVLAAVGLYGVLSYSVAQRTREIGVRVALGASRRNVLGLVVGRAMRLTAIGLGVGLLFAAGVGQLLRSQIFGVSPLDPVTFVVVILLLTAVAFLAAWLPARRAARVDPIVALQSE